MARHLVANELIAHLRTVPVDDAHVPPVEREIHVGASPETVFEVISSPEHIREWWGGAETDLSRLLERVEAGEEITFARAGKLVAKLVPYEARREPRKLGLWKGKVWLAPDWDSPEVNEEIARAFGA